MADILVVDDSPFIQSMVAALCRPEGWKVVSAGCIAEARKVLSSEKPRVVMLDYHLPDGYGPDLAPELARRDPPPVVIALSMQPREHVRGRFQEKDVHLVMDKEVLLRSDLTQVLRERLAEGTVAPVAGPRDGTE